MASIKQTPSGAFHLCVINKLPPNTLWATFDTRDAAEQYGAQLEHLLGQDIVPWSILEQAMLKPLDWTIGCCIAECLRYNAAPQPDIKLLDNHVARLLIHVIRKVFSRFPERNRDISMPVRNRQG